MKLKAYISSIISEAVSNFGINPLILKQNIHKNLVVLPKDLPFSLSKFFPAKIFFLVFWKRKIFLSKKILAGKKIYLEKTI
jgi:hypothetical protein